MADYTKRDGQIPSRFVCIYTLFSSSYRTSKKNILLLHQSLGSYSDVESNSKCKISKSA